MSSCKFLFQSKAFAFVLGVHEPKLIIDREVSHASLMKTINAKYDGDFQILYRKIDFVSKSGYEDFYSLDLSIYNREGQRADLNKTANVCETTSFGYKSFKKNSGILDEMIWESDSSSLTDLFSGLETIDGNIVTSDDFPSANIFFVSYYSSYVVGPQRRKLKILRNSLDFQKDSIMTIFINADIIKTDSAIYAAQYEGFFNQE